MTAPTTPTLHPELVALQQLVGKIDHEPAGMLQLAGQINGPGFFPAAWGSENPSLPLSARRIMVLGQDQDNLVGFKKTLIRGNEQYSATWRNMRSLFEGAQIGFGSIFFTNFIMGVRHGGRNVGPSPALLSPPFLRDCAKLFVHQLAVQRPRLIITLGLMPFTLLGLVSEELRYRSVGIASFDELDERGLSYITNVAFEGAPGIDPVVVPICHPSYPMNGGKRKFQNEDRFGDETSLLRFAYEHVGG